jgi:hypothetical protein
LTGVGFFGIIPAMIGLDLDVSKRTSTEKIALMERLWDGLSTDAVEPPDWHRAVLEERESEWTNRHTVSQDWETAKDDLRRELT